MPKKGGGKKGGKSGGAAKKKPAIPQREPPDEPLMERKPMTILTVNVRGVVWRMMDFTQRVPSTTKVHEIRSMIADRHGGGVTEFKFGTHYQELIKKEQRDLWNKFNDKSINPGEDDDDDDEEEEDEDEGGDGEDVSRKLI